jgi:hypothetical protein
LINNISYSNIENGYDGIIIADGISTVNWGSGNLSLNPFFVNEANADYHLLSVSPCINAGDPNTMCYQNKCPIDMGAYGNNIGSFLKSSIKEVYVNDTIMPNKNFPKEKIRNSLNEDIIVYPNPFDDYITINRDVEKLTIYNSIGRKVLFVNKPRGWINTSNLIPGVYLIDVDGSKTIMIKK